jgi:hypothetical protein
LQNEAQRLVNLAIEGVKSAVDQHKIPPANIQFEKRKIDHPGYDERMKVKGSLVLATGAFAVI